MMRRLIVNADDAGLASSTDDAILRCFHDGIVRSASVVANGATAAAFVHRAVQAELDLGLHLNLTEGLPLTGAVPGLVDPSGRFFGDKRITWARLAAADVDTGALAAEARAQWDALVSLGATPCHIDGHNHVHAFPVVRDALVETSIGAAAVFRNPADCTGASAPADVPDARAAVEGTYQVLDAFGGYTFTEAPSPSAFLAVLDSAAGETLEVMVHPGARAGSPYSEDPRRDVECDVLCDPALRDAIGARGWTLASFWEVLLA